MSESGMTASTPGIGKSFDAAEAERRIAKIWENEQCFKAGANARANADSYCIVIPPPNVTGSLHMGHALNNTLQDILTRWKRMQGFDTLWQPGQDHAGIATQMVVERQLAENDERGRRELGREKFIERVWAWKEESGGEIIHQLKRLGASCDWSRNRFTMDEGLSAAVLKVFVELYRAGLIYKDERLVNWDPQFETAISDLEVEQVNVAPSKDGGKLWRFRYPLEDGLTFQYREALERDDDGAVVAWSEPEERNYITVATTRPETMLGDTGVAVHPDDKRYQALIGKNIVLPLVGRKIPIVADSYADPTTGTGAVKITPAHDFNDFEVAKRCGLAAINVMTTKAAMFLTDNNAFLEGADPEPETIALDGLDRYEARRCVVEMFAARDLLDGVDDHPHNVPHGDRSKVAIEPYLTDQWFVDAKTLSQPALEAVRRGQTVFVPKNWEKTYFQWLENIEPWCISRQLWWGHRIPVWYGPDGHAFCALSEEEAYAEAEAHYGASTALTRDEDVLDTWFSSALWPFSTLGWPDQTPELARYYKTDVLVTGFDIIFFWVARMMMMGLQFMKDGNRMAEVPFHTVYIHALVRDEKGRKMAKSLGNVINPLALIDLYGADAMRFALTSMAVMGQDIKLSQKSVEGYRNFGTKLWNAARFLQMNQCYRDAQFDPKSAQRRVNQWIIGETARLRETCDAALQSYRFNDYAGALYRHIWGMYCDWYVEFTKPLLQSDDEEAKAETRKTAAWALDQILLLLHPVSPFITEELWALTAGESPRQKRLVHGDWPLYSAHELASAQADNELNWVIRLIEGIRSARAALNVPARAKIPMVVAEASRDAVERLKRNEVLVSRMARLSGWSMADQAPGGAVTLTLENATFALMIAEFIDISAEKSRLSKALSKADNAHENMSSKLSNPGFLAGAPEDVICELRERLALVEADQAGLRAALARLAEME
jgi:valyl-tRNA synthetase